ncbi:hypothetical protein ACFYOT_40615 [Saccharothrix saharensis]|uniref:hypothetical protein n=1 Tax=Saccharothrix saharensis TaxID=571190 RepID=UPI003683E335
MRISSVCVLVGCALVGGAGIASAGGTPATLYGCYGGVGQTWVVEDNETISNLGSGRTMCLDVSSYADNSPTRPR